MYGERAPREMFDVTCAECGEETTVPFKPDGRRPVKCRDCFQKDRPPRDGPRGGGGPRGGDRPEFEVTCATCGVQTTVPFEPRGDRPVQCRDCYRQSRPPRDGPRGGGGGGGRDDRPMHDASCSNCGVQTQVPFKPVPGRDVFCRDCFRNQ